MSQAVVAVESYLYVSECGVAAGMALLAFDYCLTFRNEVEWLFGTKWTPTRIHFTSLRYLPFVALALAFPTSRVLPPSETSYCGTLGTATNVMFYICIILAEAMLAVRTYAFWKRDRKMLIGMCIFAVVCVGAAIVPSKTIVSKPTNSVYKVFDCVGVQDTVTAALQYLGLILYEMSMLCLNWIAFRRMKKQNPPGQLITTLYRDGMLYMAAISLFSVINAAVTLSAPIQYFDTLNSPQMVLHSILASRIFFNLRETSQEDPGNPLPMTLTEFHATPQTSDAFNNNSTGSRSGGGINIEVTRESVVHVQDSNA